MATPKEFNIKADCFASDNKIVSFTHDYLWIGDEHTCFCTVSRKGDLRKLAREILRKLPVPKKRKVK
jgi:hypothetical protein